MSGSDYASGYYANKRGTKRRRTSAGKYAVGPYAMARRRMSWQTKGLLTRVPRGIYRFTRCTSDAHSQAGNLTMTVTQGTKTYGALFFTLEMLPGYTDFTNLYDVYRVKSLVFICRSNWDSADDVVGTSTRLDSAGIYLHTVVDTNDSTAPTMDTMRQYPSYKCNRVTDLDGTKGRQYLKPAIRLATDGSGGVSVSPKDAWISTASFDTTHYAIKWAITRPAGSRPAVDMSLDWYFKAVIECKNVK